MDTLNQNFCSILYLGRDGEYPCRLTSYQIEATTPATSRIHVIMPFCYGIAPHLTSLQHALVGGHAVGGAYFASDQENIYTGLKPECISLFINHSEALFIHVNFIGVHKKAQNVSKTDFVKPERLITWADVLCSVSDKKDSILINSDAIRYCSMHRSPTGCIAEVRVVGGDPILLSSDQLYDVRLGYRLSSGLDERIWLMLGKSLSIDSIRIEDDEGITATTFHFTHKPDLEEVWKNTQK